MELELTSSPEQATDSACQELVDVITNFTSELAASAQGSKSRELAATIQSHMASLRARISELEEFAEEQDQYVPTLASTLQFLTALNSTAAAPCSLTISAEQNSVHCEFDVWCIRPRGTVRFGISRIGEWVVSCAAGWKIPKGCCSRRVRGNGSTRVCRRSFAKPTCRCIHT